jgi:hypothetical protein
MVRVRNRVGRSAEGDGIVLITSLMNWMGLWMEMWVGFEVAS